MEKVQTVLGKVGSAAKRRAKVLAVGAVLVGATAANAEPPPEFTLNLPLDPMSIIAAVSEKIGPVVGGIVGLQVAIGVVMWVSARLGGRKGRL